MATTVDEPSMQDASGAAHPLDGIFNPKAVAVVGVTVTPGTVPYDIFHNIIASGYQGRVYPVAPGKRSICVSIGMISGPPPMPKKEPRNPPITAVPPARRGSKEYS